MFYNLFCTIRVIIMQQCNVYLKNGSRLRRGTQDLDGEQILWSECEEWSWEGAGSEGESPRGRSRGKSPGRCTVGKDGNG